MILCSLLPRVPFSLICVPVSLFPACLVPEQFAVLVSPAHILTQCIPQSHRSLLPTQNITQCIPMLHALLSFFTFWLFSLPVCLVLVPSFCSSSSPAVLCSPPGIPAAIFLLLLVSFLLYPPLLLLPVKGACCSVPSPFYWLPSMTA